MQVVTIKCHSMKINTNIDINTLSKEEFQNMFENCPVTATMNIIGGKWKPIILTRIKMGINRFGLLQRSIPTISKQMLTAQLRELEEHGIISRKVFAEIPPKVEYSITELGESVFPILSDMAVFGKMIKKVKIN